MNNQEKEIIKVMDLKQNFDNLGFFFGLDISDKRTKSFLLHVIKYLQDELEREKSRNRENSFPQPY